MNSLHVARLLRFAFSVAFGMVAFRAVADSPVPQAPLELTAANLASVVDPLMAEWIDKRKGPGAMVVVVKRAPRRFRGTSERTIFKKSRTRTVRPLA